MTGIDKIGTMTQSQAVIQNALHKNQSNKFADLLKAAQQREAADYSHISSEQVLKDGRLNGDFKTGFDKTFTLASDKNAAPQGAAANGRVRPSDKKIDKTSKLYEKSMELESFFVKMMVDSMRKTVHSSTTDSFAKSMYQDMLYDEYTTSLTKGAGFGLADQIYMELA
ncbi:MAG: rod-binding protein [Treponema sp.]|nr:rod-binding protein [Treponema sp.]